MSGPDRSAVDRLAAAYSRSASNYVAASYSAYVLERLSSDNSTGGSGPGGLQVAILALLVGPALGVALVAAELRLEPQLQALPCGGSRPTAGPSDAAAEAAAAADGAQSNGKPEREPEPARRRARRTAGQPARCRRRTGPRPAAERKPSGHRGPANGSNPARARGASMRHKDKG